VLGESRGWEVVGRRGLGVGFCGAATETTPNKREGGRGRRGRQLSTLALGFNSFLWGWDERGGGLELVSVFASCLLNCSCGSAV
jgi:hypothetical protein